MKEAEGSKARARGSLVARGDSYDVAMLWDQDEVRLTLAQSGGVERWSGCFDAQYIEEVTKKTGNSKKFAVFLQMLQAAIEQQDNSVYLDVLTCSDLRALKHRKNALSDDTASAESAQTLRSPKRYLILTYAAQFDRVHYPLPLSVEETAGSSRSQDANACALPSWQQRSSGERLALMSDPTSQPVQRLHQLQQEKEEIQAAYERLLADTSRKLAKMRRKCDGLTADLQAQTDRASALQVELVASRSSDRSLAHVQAKLQRLEQERREERNDLQHAYDKHKRELVLLNAELNRSKREAERSRRHARQLEAELKILQRRAAATRGAGTGFSGVSHERTRNAVRESSGSRCGSRATSAEQSRAVSRKNSRASSVAIASTTASRNASRINSRAPSVASGSANASRAGSRSSSRVSSVPNSRERSAPPSRSSSAERSRSPSRDPRAFTSVPRPTRTQVAGTPSLGQAAREALQQTRKSQHPASRHREQDRAPSPLSRGLPGATDSCLTKQHFPHRFNSDDVGRVKSERARHTNKGIESIDIEANSRSAKINAATDSQKENLDVVDRVRCARFESGVAPALDVTQDIRDIDRRLSALQSYLKTAKGSQ